MAKLTKLTLRGYKSIKEATIEFGSMNVLIGANGAGKSSLVSFFRLLNEMMGERLQQFIAQNGRAQPTTHRNQFAKLNNIVVAQQKCCVYTSLAVLLCNKYACEVENVGFLHWFAARP